MTISDLIAGVETGIDYYRTLKGPARSSPEALQLALMERQATALELTALMLVELSRDVHAIRDHLEGGGDVWRTRR